MLLVVVVLGFSGARGADSSRPLAVQVKSQTYRLPTLLRSDSTPCCHMAVSINWESFLWVSL